MHLVAVDISLKKKSHAETAALLEAQEERFDLFATDLESNPDYAEFVASEAYQEWMDRRQGREMQRETFGDRFSADPIPEGFMLMEEDLERGEKTVGRRYTVLDPDKLARAVVEVESTPVPALDFRRRTAFNALLKSTTQILTDLGLVIATTDVPSLAAVNFSLKVPAYVVFVDEEGNVIELHMQVFFGAKTFNCYTFGPIDDDHRTLLTWMRSVRELP